MLKYFIPLLAIITVSSDLSAQLIGQETAFDRQLRQNDDQALREFVSSKENIDVKKKANNLDISGDVRFEWRTIREKSVTLYDRHSASSAADYDLSSDCFSRRYRNIRGNHYVDMNNIPVSHNDFDVEFNLKIKYSFEKAWAMAHLQFDNPAGIRGRDSTFGNFPVFDEKGHCVNRTINRNSRLALTGSGLGLGINLKRAYIGYNVYADGKHRFDIEVGRRKMDDVFVSEVEFSSRFDGILLKYASEIEDFSDWYCNAGVFVIDERINHFGYVTEIGLLDIMDLDLDVRYSFIDWTKRGENRSFVRNPLGTLFQNSQVSFSYTIHPTFRDKELPIEFYGGFLVNHAARRNVFTHYKKKNLAWYAGIYFGNVNKKGDWALDIEYVGVQAQAVPEFDVASIGRGNLADGTLTDILNGIPPTCSYMYYDSYGVPSYSGFSSSDCGVYFPRRGNCNFVGVRVEFLYAITDNLSIDMIYELSQAEDCHIGGRHFYSDFELEAIYAF